MTEYEQQVQCLVWELLAIWSQTGRFCERPEIRKLRQLALRRRSAPVSNLLKDESIHGLSFSRAP